MEQVSSSNPVNSKEPSSLELTPSPDISKEQKSEIAGAMILAMFSGKYK